MNVSAIKNLHYKWYMKILSKMEQVFRRANIWKNFLISKVVLRELSFYSFMIWLISNITNVHALICTTVQIKNLKGSIGLF